MHLTREADYALRIMYTLAVNNKLTDAQTISDSIAVTRRFTLKILSKLTEAGLASSKLGAGGGYYLAKPADEISIAEVIEAIEGPFAISTCLAQGYTCERVDDCGNCIFHCIFDVMNEDMRKTLAAVSIGDAAALSPLDMQKQIRLLSEKKSTDLNENG